MSDEFSPVANVDNLAEIDDAFSDVIERARRLRPAFVALRKPLRGDQREHAKEAKGPDGAWPARSPVTEARRRMRNRRIRQTKAMRTISPRPSKRRSSPKALLGRLPRAMIVTLGDLFIRATSRASWSGSHNKGDKVGHGRKVELPRRTFMYLSNTILRIATEVIAGHLVKDWKRR